MNRRAMGTLLLLFFLVPATPAPAQDPVPIQLPAPRMEGGKPLLEALRDRRTGRSFRPDPLALQTLSDLLWAGFGVNRPETGGRTAPSAMNWQEVEVFVTLPEGAYRYDSRANRLEPVGAGDLRALTGIVPFVGTAPLNLVYVADQAKMTRASAEDRALYSAVNTGTIVQNVYLFCASEGLATVVRAQVEREPLAKALGLRPEQKIIVAQTVGYPGG